MEPDHPPYWSSQMPQLALHHGELPGVERHQRTYVRYGNTAHATDVTASLGWQKSVSLRTNQCQTADGKLLASLAQLPDAMNMHIVRAPAAFAVPVKQDKRLKPPFKVSLSVTYSARMSCPVVVTAHVLTEADFARVETWMPPEIESSVTMVDRQTATKLKGNRAIEWQYDGDAIGAADIQSAELPTLSELMASSPLNLSNMSITADDALYNMLGTASLAGSDALFDQASLRGASNTSLDPDFLDLEALLNEGPDAASRRLAALNNGNGRRTQALGSRTVSHEFEFGDLEFDKPSRMRKVYIAFACQVGGQDVIYTVFHVPTICVCRREQKERAYQLLGIPYRSDTPVRNNHVRTPTHALQPPAQRMRLDPLHDGERSLSVESDESKQTPDKMLEAVRHAPLQAESGWFTASFVSEFILESYAGLGMQRQLTRQDITALLEQAGFPQMDAHNTDARISPEQFEEFKGGWKCILHLLQLIHHCWNKEDPLVVCGFDMDRKHALGALYSEPPGTFLCRFSLSQPGDMVLDLKVPSHSHADEHGVAHAILNVQDLKDHRVDKWIIDYPGATHLLDVSRSRRIDKRRAFHSPYCRFDTLYRFQSMGPDQQEVSST